MSTIYLKKGERAMINATAETKLFLFGLPDLTGMKLGQLSGAAAPDDAETAEAAE
jgi:hypothetical protein